MKVLVIVVVLETVEVSCLLLIKNIYCMLMIDRGRNFQDRNGGNRNQDDDNNTQRSHNFTSNRGGFQNRRDQGEGGGFERRGGSRGGRGGTLYMCLYFTSNFFDLRWIW